MSAVVSVDPEALLRGARARLAEQRWDEAERCCRELLAQDPDHPEALGLLGLALADGPRRAEAAPVLLRHLALRPNDRTSLHRLARIRARDGQYEAAALLLQRASQALADLAVIQNDLAVVLDRLGREEEALAAADRAVAVAPDFALAHDNRGVMLLREGRFSEALDAELLALAHLPADQPQIRAGIAHNLCQAALKAGRVTEAETALHGEIAAGRDVLAMLAELSTLLETAGRLEDAVAARNLYARRAGVRWSGRADGGEAKVLVLAGAHGGLAPLRYLIDPDVFATLGFTFLSADQPDAPFGEVDVAALREADVVFSALADVDHDGGQFDMAAEVCARIGRPVLNPPSAIARTGRHQAAALFGDIPDMITPEVRYIDRAGLQALAITAPMLVRRAGSHGGENLVLLRDEADKAAFLAGAGEGALQISPFHHFQSADGHWRKYRLIFIDRQVHPYHLAIGDHWLVHYWRAAMERSDWKKAEEKRFLEDWRAVFGERAALAVEEAARRLDLDCAGMDCALTADGQVLLFEANACVLVHLDDDPVAFPYKHEYVPRIREAFTRMVRERTRPPS